MSDVFKAFDPALNRFVALKTISRTYGLTDEVRKRFYREAQAAARLNHPNIITVYELGEDEGRIFIAMELLEGSDLKDIISSSEKLDLDQKLDIMEQIADGSGFAHSKGIVHRDLKPGNIHIDLKHRVKIMDFGLARLASSNITRSGMVMGTPNYMSPEQVRGERVDTPSDVFSLGAILYELLSYCKPFKGDSLHNTMLKVLKGERPPLSSVAPETPDPLARVVDRALALSPSGRYRNGKELLQALRECRKSSKITWMATPAAASSEPLATPPDAKLEGGAPAAPVRSLAGSLDTMHLADLLQWCAIKEKTGTLRVRHGPIEKRLYFRDGTLFSSTSNSPRETLGQLLIRSGHINEEQLFTALVEQEQIKQPLGWILISKGLLSQSELQDLLQLKCEESIYDCFLWTDGEFVFEDHQVPEKVPASFSLDMSHVIQEGIDRMEKWDHIRERFPSRLTTFSLNQVALDSLDEGELTEEDRRILDLIEKDKNLAEIALELHAVDFYAAERLLALCERGCIFVAKVPKELPYEREVEKLRKRLAEGLKSFQQGEHAKALRAFEAALKIDPQSKANLFVDKLAGMVEDANAIKKVPREGVPVVRIPLEELEQLSITPQEGFVLSRISGDWDIRSILKICPLGELEVLKIIKGLLDKRIIELKTNQEISSA
jgi:serine/threonine protein kinase